MIVERLFLSVLKFEELKKQAVFNYSVSYVPNPLTYVRVFGFDKRRRQAEMAL